MITSLKLPRRRASSSMMSFPKTSNERQRLSREREVHANETRERLLNID